MILGRIFSNLIIKFFGKSNFELITPNGKIYRLGDSSFTNPLTLHVNDWSFFGDLVLGFDLGFAKSYINSKWDCNDLTGLFKELSSSKSKINAIANYAPFKLKAIVGQRIRSTNSLNWAKRNIADHYDMSNEFFQMFLDKSMTYSCAIFRPGVNDLQLAQNYKVTQLLGKANLQSSDHILDIGCGWGKLITQAALDYGCKSTGVTLSKNQYTYCRALIQKLKLEDKVKVKLVDYRLINGKFDHIFSIEMLEAVGHNGLETFFKKCNLLIRDKGTIQIQVINIPDERYDSYRLSCDFIQKYIFPGGLLPSLAIMESTAIQNGFIIDDLVSIGPHYVKTLEQWKVNLQNNWNKIKDYGFGIKDYRRFEYYFSYCSGAFGSSHIDNHQLSISKVK